MATFAGNSCDILGIANVMGAHYLGLKCQIAGKTHYGWARLNVSFDHHSKKITGTLTGYAYETIPNKPIITGKTKGPDVITVQPGSLGALAAGASSRKNLKRSRNHIPR